MILNLAVWFSIHALFARVTEVRLIQIEFDAPVWSTVNVSALMMAFAAAIAIFRLRCNVLTVLGSCALAGIALRLAGIA